MITLNQLLQRTNGVLPVNKSTCALGGPSVFFGRRYVLLRTLDHSENARAIDSSGKLRQRENGSQKVDLILLYRKAELPRSE